MPEPKVKRLVIDLVDFRTVNEPLPTAFPENHAAIRALIDTALNEGVPVVVTCGELNWAVARGAAAGTFEYTQVV